MSDLYSLADFIAYGVNDEDKIDALKSAVFFLDSIGELGATTYADLVGDHVNEELAKNVYYELENYRIIQDGTSDRAEVEKLFEGAKVICGREKQPENMVVATIPEGEDLPNRSRFGQLLLELRDLIMSAEEEIFILSPFFSEKILRHIEGPLEGAVSRGVTIRLVTRYLTYKERHGGERFNRGFVKSLVENDNIRPGLELYEYVGEEDNVTFHAKLVVSDDKYAYLGTANLTHKGLSENLELGIIFRDKNVRQFYDLGNTLLRSKFLHTIKWDGREFIRA